MPSPARPPSKIKPPSCKNPSPCKASPAKSAKSSAHHCHSLPGNLCCPPGVETQLRYLRHSCGARTTPGSGATVEERRFSAASRCPFENWESAPGVPRLRNNRKISRNHSSFFCLQTKAPESVLPLSSSVQ